MLENHRNSQHFHENSNWCSKTWEILLRDGTGMEFFMDFSPPKPTKPSLKGLEFYARVGKEGFNSRI